VVVHLDPVLAEHLAVNREHDDGGVRRTLADGGDERPELLIGVDDYPPRVTAVGASRAPPSSSV
jgi:hypothetical protein